MSKACTLKNTGLIEEARIARDVHYHPRTGGRMAICYFISILNKLEIKRSDKRFDLSKKIREHKKADQADQADQADH